MRRKRLKLVVPEASATTEGTTGLPAVAAMPRAVAPLLRLVDADGGASPDDAA